MDASTPSRADVDPDAIAATADELEAQGRFLDAAHALTEIPRDERAPEVDVRIVRLRHLAFRDLRHTPADGPWPRPVGPDPFPVVGAPEVPFSQVTPDLLASSIKHHGCLIARNILPADLIGRLRQDIDRAFDGVEATRGAETTPDTSPWYVPLTLDAGYELDPFAGVFLFSAGGVYAGASPRSFLDYVEALQVSGVTDLIRDYLGETPVLSLNKTVLRRIGGGASPSWHQDGWYLGVGIRAVDLWVALSQCGGDTEVMGLDVLPRPMEDLAEMGGYDAIDPRAVSQHVVGELSRQAGVPVERPLFQPGDGILFDPVFIHRSDPRPLPQLRYAIESWWFGPSTFPDNQVPLVAT